MLRRIGILTLCQLCLVGAGGLGCGSDHGGSSNQEHPGAAGSTGDGNNPDQQTGNTAGNSGVGGFTGTGPGAGGGSGATPGSGAQGPGPGPNNSARVQFVLKEVH